MGGDGGTDDHAIRKETTAARLQILDALVTALDRRGEMLAVVSDAEDTDAARRTLIDLLGVNEVGADAILELPVRRLPRREAQRVRDERDTMRTALGS